jgi:hypothetical protein
MRAGRTGLLALGLVLALTSVTTAALAAPARQPDSHVAVQHGGRTLTAATAAPLYTLSNNGPYSYTFSLSGGVYMVGVAANYDLLFDQSGTGYCLFYGYIDGVQNSLHVDLSDNGEVTGMVDYFYNPVVTLPAGDYTLDVEYPTTCDWSVNIYFVQAAPTPATTAPATTAPATTAPVTTAPPTTVRPTISIVSVGAYRLRSGKLTPASVVPTAQPFYLVAFCKAAGTLPATLTGRVTLQERPGRPTSFGLGWKKGFCVAYTEVVYPKKAVPGHVVATFTLSAGSLRASRVLKFTLVNPLDVKSG